MMQALFNDMLWFLRFLISRPELTQLVRMRLTSLLTIRGVGATYARAIQSWQSHAVFSHEVAWVGEMIQADATRILELLGQMKMLEAKIDAVAQESSVASILDSIPGFGQVCSAELAGLMEDKTTIHNVFPDRGFKP